jgi:hypothetical protein
MYQDLGFFHFGKSKKRFSGRIYSYFQSRTFLEWKLRQRVAALSSVKFLDGTDVTQYIPDETKTRITGVGVQSRGDSIARSEDLPAALEEDASGRGSRTPQFGAAVLVIWLVGYRTSQ